MAISLPRPTGAVPSTPTSSDTQNPADRYALWFFAITLVLSLLAAGWVMLGL